MPVATGSDADAAVFSNGRIRHAYAFFDTNAGLPRTPLEGIT
ncbi:hypothetical protein FRAHR75_1480006 [Frankia sp. Hr75.2]|nr:hypothetical protein FRAHR75_1480006 [Frankia sp. Hr75.2]SQD94092.1 hypothetical protein FMEAI12_2260005 [Parafrankia sp. Ea1.12]